MDPAMSQRPNAWTNRRLRNCDPRSELSRIRLNADYAEVCVKPRICGDVLRSWGVLADFSA
ncbi:hypothetical protein BZL30_5945 [Mycobacterium kansasii]|uniref:Uncharacterized protein n=1 Tax=Mycobacterium kansasii TaxID=1768 RepID=A0A1V3WNY3_MYCKA|nr:hypothetical protein BZL29_6569 [Mycobacterium kansasii]OOK72218.1 hypothetical protein BZL30_5945 [Mycobacterium kansasii]